jgi:hypothetical protein
MRRVGRLSAAVLLVVVVAGVVVIASPSRGSGSVASAAAPGTITVPIQVVGGPATATTAKPMVRIRVGSGPMVPVLLDTGSSGLQLFAPQVPTGPTSGVSVTATPDRITYAGGHRFIGQVARAVVTVGPARTPRAISFGLVQTAVCIPTQPLCPVAAGGVSSPFDGGAWGILGIGLLPGPDGLANPLTGMIEGRGHRWSVHLNGSTGALVLGAPAPTASSQVASFGLASAGTAGGIAFWKDASLPTCVTVGPAAGCGPSLFDTGTAQMQVQGRAYDALAVSGAGRLVAAGLGVSVARPGASAPLWTSTTGTTKSVDTVLLRDGDATFVNFGIEPFFRFVVSYDAVAGTLDLSRWTKG